MMKRVGAKDPMGHPLKRVLDRAAMGWTHELPPGSVTVQEAPKTF